MDTLEEKSNNKIWDIKIGAQDVDYSSGSRTGAVAIKMFEDFGIDFAIIGHSERREYFNEDNDFATTPAMAKSFAPLTPNGRGGQNGH